MLTRPAGRQEVPAGLVEERRGVLDTSTGRSVIGTLGVHALLGGGEREGVGVEDQARLDRGEDEHQHGGRDDGQLHRRGARIVAPAEPAATVREALPALGVEVADGVEEPAAGGGDGHDDDDGESGQTGDDD